MPTNETEAHGDQHESGGEVRVRHVQAEERGDRDEHDRRTHDPVADREDPRTQQVRGARQRCHERVLDGPFPSLPRDGLDQQLEDDPEVGPHDRSDQQDRGQLVDVDLAAGRLDALGDEDDRERVRGRPEEERDLPPRVAA
jgi:hypothetical protein